MADQNMTDFTQETYSTLDGTEQLCGFDSAEAKRVTVQAVGEYVLKKLTTSLNGSNQTVANALSSLNSDMQDSGYKLGTAIPNGSDLDSYTTAGVYVASTSALSQSISNKPNGVTTSFRLEVVQNASTTYIKQYLYNTADVQRIYIRQKDGTSNAWKPWYVITGTAVS